MILKIMIYEPKMLPFLLSVKLGLLNHGEYTTHSTLKPVPTLPRQQQVAVTG